MCFSRIEINRDEATGLQSGIYVRKFGNYDGYSIDHDFPDPVSFGIKSEFKSGMQVWRFMCNLMKNFFHRENIAITVNDKTREGCFWKFEDVFYWDPNKPGFNLVPSEKSIAFRSLITVMSILIPEKDSI